MKHLKIHNKDQSTQNYYTNKMNLKLKYVKEKVELFWKLKCISLTSLNGRFCLRKSPN